MTKLSLRQANHVELTEEQTVQFNKGQLFQSNAVLAEGIAEPGELPDWIQLTPSKGKFEGRDGRKFNIRAPNKIVKEFNASGDHLLLDVDHESEMFFGSTIASGWISKMAVRNGGEIWGQTEFTPSGGQLVINRDFRGISPVLKVTQESFIAFLDDPSSAMEVEGILSAALTNMPNLRLRSLNTKKENTMEREVLIKLLGLNAEASDEDITEAITALKDKPEPAAPEPQPNASEMVPRADLELVKTKLAELTAANAKRDKDAFEAECRATVDAASEAGKIAPASKEYHLNTCLSGPTALKAFMEYIGAAVEQVANTQMQQAAASNAGGGPPAALTAEERLMCKKLNLKPEEYHAAQTSIRDDEETYHPKAYAFVH